jgi:predicted RND superfamily exporter protein
MLHTLRFSLQNAVYFIMLPFLVSVLITFYIQGVLNLNVNSGAKRLTSPKEVKLKSFSSHNMKKRYSLLYIIVYKIFMRLEPIKKYEGRPERNASYLFPWKLQ